MIGILAERVCSKLVFLKICQTVLVKILVSVGYSVVVAVGFFRVCFESKVFVTVGKTVAVSICIVSVRADLFFKIIGKTVIIAVHFGINLKIEFHRNDHAGKFVIAENHFRNRHNDRLGNRCDFGHNGFRGYFGFCGVGFGICSVCFSAFSCCFCLVKFVRNNGNRRQSFHWFAVAEIGFGFSIFCTAEVKAYRASRSDNGVVFGIFYLKAAVAVFDQLAVPKVVNGNVAVKGKLPSGNVGIGSIFDNHFSLICINEISRYIIVYIVPLGYVNSFRTVHNILRNFEFIAGKSVTEIRRLTGSKLVIIACAAENIFSSLMTVYLSVPQAADLSESVVAHSPARKNIVAGVCNGYFNILISRPFVFNGVFNGISVVGIYFGLALRGNGNCCCCHIQH